jgi:hypothetical protein
VGRPEKSGKRRVSLDVRVDDNLLIVFRFPFDARAG